MKRSFKPYQKGTTEKRQKTITLTQKFPWKSSLTTHLLFLSSNFKTLKAFSKTVPSKMIPTKGQAQEKKWGKKSKRTGEERKWKEIVKTAVSLLNPKTKFCLLHMLEFFKLIFCIWIRRPWNAWPANSFMVSFSSL